MNAYLIISLFCFILCGWCWKRGKKSNDEMWSKIRWDEEYLLVRAMGKVRRHSDADREKNKQPIEQTK